MGYMTTILWILQSVNFFFFFFYRDYHEAKTKMRVLGNFQFSTPTVSLTFYYFKIDTAKYL